MRPFLALDTATDHLALAIGDLDSPGSVLATQDMPAPRAANTVVLLAAERLIESAGIAITDLAAVVCGRGPGSFTGVRIGVATAKGLAHGLGVPLAGCSTLDAIAWRVDAEGLVGVVGDAMRGEVYPALYRAHAGTAVRISPDRVCRPDDIAAEWAGLDEPVTLAGNGLTKHGDVFGSILGARARIAPERQWTPDGMGLVLAAWAADDDPSLPGIMSRDEGQALLYARPSALLPVYTRLADAEEAERVRLGEPRTLPDGGVAGPPPGEASRDSNGPPEGRGPA